MAADIFGDRLHRDVDAVRERVEQHSRRPRVVKCDQCIARMRRRNDGRQVLHFHRNRAGAFGPNQTRPFIEQLADFGANGRIVKGRAYAESREQRRRELPVWTIHALREKNMIAGLQQGEIDERDRRLSAWRENRVPPRFELADACGKFERRGRSVEAVGIPRALLVPVVGDAGRIGEERGRPAVDRRRKRTISLRNTRLGVQKPRLPGAHKAAVSFERAASLLDA